MLRNAVSSPWLQIMVGVECDLCVSQEVYLMPQGVIAKSAVVARCTCVEDSG